MKAWSSNYTALLILILVALIAVPLAFILNSHALVAWVSTLVILMAFILIIGHGTTGVWRGALIDDRNVISLSRFQMVIWTLIVLSALFTAAFCNLNIGNADPLNIYVPSQLWVLMGISTTSLVGSSLILGTKKQKNPSSKEQSKTIQLLLSQGDQKENLGNNGLLITNSSPSSARWSDMLTGEETSNAAHLDLSRIQMFFFTLIVVITYLAAVGNMFYYMDETGISAMPSLDNSVLALIAMSHGGYLVSKGVTTSKQENSDQPDPEVKIPLAGKSRKTTDHEK